MGPTNCEKEKIEDFKLYLLPTGFRRGLSVTTPRSGTNCFEMKKNQYHSSRVSMEETVARGFVAYLRKLTLNGQVKPQAS